jgi:hypothetical protein
MSAAVDELITEGLTFDNLRGALAYLYFGYDDITQDEWKMAMEHVTPMQHNIENPITFLKSLNLSPKDTFIEYWIDDDDRMTQDHGGWTTIKEGIDSKKWYRTNECMKLARVTVRFIGAVAEAWAKLLQHSTMREDMAGIFREYCNADILEHIGSIRPINVDYFGNQNTAVAYDITMMLQYKEVIKLPGDKLGLISIAAGDMKLQG